MFNKKSFTMGLVLGIFGTLAVGVIGFLYMSNAQLLLKLSLISNRIANSYVDPLTEKQKEQMQQGIYEGFVSGVQDPYTAYFSPKEFEDFMTETKGEYAGIGVVVVKDPKDNLITVVAPFEGSPGAKAGVLPKDKILKVNNTDVTNMDQDKAVALIKGEPGTKVTLSILRPSTGKNLSLSITRDIIKMETVKSETLNNNIGYIRISQFEEKTAQDFMKDYSALREKKIKGLVIDLRNNPGGLLEVVTQIADVLVPKGDVVYTIDNKGKKKQYLSDSNQIDIPLVLLTNGNSASASEILSGAVKDYKVGTLVGTKTFGKGVVQSILPLPDGSAIKITTSRYYTPKGISIHGVGIEPDIKVELSPELENSMEIPRDKDLQLKKALEILQ